MTEKELWVKLDAAMGTLWHAQRHEDKFSPDVPDVSFTFRGLSGWLELKCSTPSGTRPVMIPKLKPGQLNWMVRRVENGGKCYVLWLAGSTLLLIPATLIGSFDEKRDMSVWQRRAIWSGPATAPGIQECMLAAKLNAM